MSLRTDDPAEVKARLATVDEYLENVWRALRDNAQISLTHRQQGSCTRVLSCVTAHLSAILSVKKDLSITYMAGGLAIPPS